MKWWQLILGNATVTRLVVVALVAAGLAGTYWYKDALLWWAQWQGGRCETKLHKKTVALAELEAKFSILKQTDQQAAARLVDRTSAADKVKTAETAAEVNQWLKSRFAW